MVAISDRQCPDQKSISVYQGANILITGSVGTVGSELLNQIIECEPAEVRLYDNNESGLFMQMQQHGRSNVKLVPILDDIRDLGKLQAVMEGARRISSCRL